MAEDAPLGLLLTAAINGEIRSLDIIDELNRRFNAMLGAYVNHPSAFRDLLDSTESVISGSFVARFLEGDTNWRESNMDCCVDAVTAHRIRDHLVNEGYEEDTRVQNGPIYDGADATIQRVLPMFSRTKSRHIHIVVSTKKTSLYPIADFWATHLANFLSGNALCVAYPQTLKKVGLVVPGKVDEWRLPIIEGKYRHRGYKFLPLEDRMRGATRHFGDPECIVIPVQRGGRLFCGGQVANTVIWKL
ncbi:hypothetical protein NLI96_g12068 [Meripilus lineatus]|uniref:Uncharacterized protein n=1 Tax=Meripilus lineatus TaxID=2056292 RepID=A0AAD5Y7X5_9APHY|nr:hypothetical protein NLI96_g12068 [Physisporinus lineatus]